MSTRLANPPEESPPFPVRRWTVAEYRQLAESGILTEDDRVELLEGWIVPKMTHNPAHDSTVQRLLRPLLMALPAQWDLRVQSAIDTDDSEPEPDLAIVRGDSDKYLSEHPTAGDVALAVEVADSSLRKDRAKARIYASAGIPCFWIINVNDRQIELHTDPDPPQRQYRQVRILKPGESLGLTLDGQPVAEFPVDKLLPPA